MKKQFLLTMILGAFAASAMAAVAPDKADLPFLATNDCGAKSSIVIPDADNQYSPLYNLDCSTAFLLPPPTAKVEVAKPSFLEPMSSCGSYNETMLTVDKIQKEISALATADNIPEKNQKIKDLKETLQLVGSLFEDAPGVRLQLNFKGGSTAGSLQAAEAANLPLLERGLIHLRSAPIDESVLSFFAVNPNAPGYRSSGIIESNIAGLKADVPSTDEQKNVVFNGNASGVVVLNLMAACPLAKGDYHNFQSLDFDYAATSTFLVANQTFSVPLLNSFGYDAVLKVNDATDLLFSKYGQNGQFSVKDITNLVLQGQVSNLISIISWNFADSNSSNPNDKAITDQSYLNEIRQSLMAAYLDQLVSLNILSKVDVKSTPAAGTSVATGLRYECSTESSLFGLMSNSRCAKVTYQYSVSRDGVLDQRANITNQFKGNFENRQEFLEPVYRKFTTNFEFKGR